MARETEFDGKPAAALVAAAAAVAPAAMVDESGASNDATPPFEELAALAEANEATDSLDAAGGTVIDKLVLLPPLLPRS